MTIKELHAKRDQLADDIGRLVAAFQETTGLFVSGIAIQTVTTVLGSDGKGGHPPESYTETRVGVGISLERP